MTDNDNAYRSHDFRDACASAGVRHLRTRPYTPRTNGKAERFLQTIMRERTYAHPFQSSQERAAARKKTAVAPAVARSGEAELLAQIRHLVDARPSYGYWRITALLSRWAEADGLAGEP